MKFSSKMERCGLSPMRKFNPYVDALNERGVKVYHLNIGQPDVLTPKPFYDALKTFADPVLCYCPSGGVPAYVDAVRGYYERIGVKLDKSEILPTYGGSEAIQLCMACILDDGDEILMPEPYYPNYHTSVTLAGATVRPIPTYVEEDYFYADRERVESCINEKTKAILIINPGNPTGSVLTPEQMKLMLDIAKEHDLPIVFDEVYREFTYNGEPLMSALQFEGYEKNVIVIDSVSKRFSATGARVGVVISRNREFMAEAMKWCQCRLCSATVDQVGAAALYAMDPSYFDAVRDEYRKRRDTAIRKLREIPDVKFGEPKGAFYIMASLPIDDAEKFQMFLLNDFTDSNETVVFACGEPFYVTPGRGRNEIRIAYTVNCEEIERGLDIIKIAIEKYNNR